MDIDALREKFAAATKAPIPESGCLIWMDNIADGYGYIYHKGKCYGAHRISALLDGKDIDGFDVLHRCDIPCCVAPAHLFLGTQADNNRDMTRKGRNRSKSRVTHCKHGHEFTPENTRMVQGGKRCVTCARLRKAVYVAKAKSMGMTYGFTAQSKPRYVPARRSHV